MGGIGTIPWEAMNHRYDDHDWWVDGSGRCYDLDCPRHVEPDYVPFSSHGHVTGRKRVEEQSSTSA